MRKAFAPGFDYTNAGNFAKLFTIVLAVIVPAALAENAEFACLRYHRNL